MGYYTHFTITMYDYKDGQKEKIAEINDCREHYTEEEQVFVDDIKSFVGYLPTEDSCKWYDHEEDMQKLSQRHPTTLFELHGEGEQPGDIWKKWFLNGKMQVCIAEIIIPEFDQQLLK